MQIQGLGNVKPQDLLDAARHQINVAGGRPKQAHLLRAVSTTYYALFHALARCCANQLIGGIGSARSEKAWHQVYRALDHGQVKKSCKDTTIINQFPTEIQNFAYSFVTMQEKRHRADYNPSERVLKSAVELDINEVEQVITDFEGCSAKDKRAFAAFVLLKLRPS